MKLLCLFLLVLSAFDIIDGAKVLGVLPFGTKSHFAIGHAIVKALVDAGHEATVISPYPMKKPMKNYRDISTADVIKKYMKGL